jgi:methyl-accepting chemotaxis protein
MEVQKNELVKQQRSDKLVEYMLWAYFIFGVALSFFYETYFVGLVIGFSCLALYYATKIMFPQLIIHRYVASLVLGVFMAQFIYQMHGLFEMHFTAFIALLILITYENWKTYIPLTVFVVLHHSLFAYIQYLGYVTEDELLRQIYFTQMDFMDVTTFVFHAGIFVAGVFIAGLFSINSEKATQLNIDYLAKLNAIQKESEAKAKEMESVTLELQNSKIKEDQERFVVQGLNKLTEIIRKKGNSFEELARETIVFIVNHLGMNQGAFFIAENESSETADGEIKNEVVLRLKGCYAYEREKFMDKKITIGEGLVGQSFLENDVLYITDIPQDYVTITSGLGEALPKCLLIVPIKNENGIFGIIEVASFSDMPSYHKSFVERAAESIAGSIQTLKTNLRTQELLEESKRKSIEMEQQTIELRSKEEQMLQNMEEVIATQEELERREEEMRGMLGDKQEDSE